MSTFTHYRVKSDNQLPDVNPNEPTHEIIDNYTEELLKKMKIEITELTDDSIQFDLVGIDVSLANALRRILLAEVPTVAIEKVWIAINTSVIQDEVLAHRIGLIPISADPKKLDYVVGEEETDRDTLVFHYDVECKNEVVLNANGKEGFVNETAYSGSLEWLAQGNQEEVFPEGVKPVLDDIVLSKLRPGQRIEFEAHCRKGVGKDHTKFSPVATASYRLLPHITFNKEVTGAAAEELVAKCPMKVFDIEDLGNNSSNSNNNSKNKKAVVARPRDCTMCRECIRTGEGADKVELRRQADHFLFSVESVGTLAPEVIVREAISILKDKAVKFQNLIEEYESSL